MGIILEKQKIDEFARKLLEDSTLGEGEKNYVRHNINYDEIIDFIQNGINRTSVYNLMHELNNPVINSLDDIVYCFSLMLKKDALVSTVKLTHKIMKEMSSELTNDERANILIDLSISENIDYISKLMKITLHDDLI